MATKKCDCTKKSTTSRRQSNKNVEASTDNARTNSRSSAKKTSSRTRACS